MADNELNASQGVAEAEPVQTADVLNSDDTTTETVESTEGAEATEAPATEPEPEEKPKPKAKSGLDRRIADLTWQREEEKRISTELRKERDAALALVEATNRGDAPTGSPKPAMSDADVQRRAEQIVSEQSYKRAVEGVIKAGTAEFPDFNDNCSILADLGANERPEFLQLVTDSDVCENGHKVLQYLGQNADEAYALLKLSPTKMAAKLANLSDKVAKPKPIPVSAAPAPIKPIDGRARGEGDPAKMSDAEFDKFYGAKLEALRAR